MGKLSPTRFRAVCFVLTALTIGSVHSSAAVIQSTVELPPAAGSYSFGTFCFAPLGRCTVNPTVGGFTNITREQVDGNEVVTADASYSADIYTITGGSPGMLIGTLLMSGSITIVYEGRDTNLNPLGVFSTILSDFSFEGMLGGNTFAIKQDPARKSTGTTSILPLSLTPPINYIVEGSIDVMALYSFAGSPFVPAPGRTGELVEDAAVPEPSTFTAGAGLLIGLLTAAWRRRREDITA